ncbi:MAG: cyclic nucleotide-binding domain-containing protein [bacterium]
MGDERTDDFSYLKKHSLFGGVTEEAFAEIRPLVQTLEFVPGQDIVTEGAVNDRIYLIVKGSVEILKAFPQRPGEFRRITNMREGDTFGEMELIDIQPCAATVRALEATTTLTLSNRDLYSISKRDMKTYAILIMNLAREISRRLRATDELVADANLPRRDDFGSTGHPA